MSRLLDTKRGQRRQKYEFCVAPPPCRNRARYRRPSGAAGANWLAEAGRGLGQPAARCGAEGGLRRASLGRSPSQRVFGLGALTRCRCMVPGPAPTRCPSQPQPGARASPTPKQVLCVRARSTALEDLGRRFTADDKRMEEGRGRAEEVSHSSEG